MTMMWALISVCRVIRSSRSIKFSFSSSQISHFIHHMHPLEIVSLITTVVACCTCCIIVGRKSYQKRLQMIDLDHRAAFPSSQTTLQIGSVRPPSLSHASIAPSLRQPVPAHLNVTLPRSTISSTSTRRNGETLFAESPRVIADMQRTMRDVNVPSCDSEFSWQSAHYNRGGTRPSG